MSDNDEKKLIFRCKRCGKHDRQAKGHVVQRATVEITGAVWTKGSAIFVPQFESHQTSYYRLAPEPDLRCVSCNGEVEFMEYDPKDCPHNFGEWQGRHNYDYEVSRRCRACGRWENGMIDLDSIKKISSE